MKYAVIDIGSNSVRLLLWSDGKTLYKTLNTTRLGEGLALTGKLSDDAILRTSLAIRDFKQQAKAENADRVYAFATAAVRSATNGKAFTQAVKEIANLDVDVISGEEEAAIGLLGALEGKDGGIIDIGGGSTELTLQKNNSVAYSKSLDIGAVRLFDMCGRDRNKLEEVIQNKILSYGKAECNVPMYGIGGTATSLAALSLGLKEYQAQKVQDYVLTRTKLKTLTEELFTLSPEQIVEKSCLPLKRAEIIAGGALLLYRLLGYLRVEEITVSEKDNLEGYILKRISE